MLESPDMVDQKSNPGQMYLASNSPRRRELLALTGWEYSIQSAQIDETPLRDEDGAGYVRRLANSKALAAANQLDGDGIIIAADTTVVDLQPDGKSILLGKPRDPDDAREILWSLRGHSHEVHTAITILSKPEGKRICDMCTTQVPMREYTAQEVDDYVASGDSLDKAGAYAIQHAGFHPVEKLDGFYANVMGLPLCHLTRSVSKLGITPLSDVPQACQNALDYQCPVYSQILKGSLQDYTCG